MPTYCDITHDPVVTDTPEEAATVYAVKKARKAFGRAGGCLELRLIEHTPADFYPRWKFLAVIGPAEPTPGMPQHGIEINLSRFRN